MSSAYFCLHACTDTDNHLHCLVLFLKTCQPDNEQADPQTLNTTCYIKPKHCLLKVRLSIKESRYQKFPLFQVLLDFSLCLFGFQ